MGLTLENEYHPEDFRAIAGYLEGNGWIAEADPDYGIFVLTPKGVVEATS